MGKSILLWRLALRQAGKAAIWLAGMIFTGGGGPVQSPGPREPIRYGYFRASIRRARRVGQAGGGD